MSEELSALEKAVIGLLLEGQLRELDLLRAQVRSVRVRLREWTGAGFWTELEGTDLVPRLPRQERLQVTGVYGRHPSLQAGIGFTLHLEQGALSSLEGYTYEEPWPASLHELELFQEPVGPARKEYLSNLLHSDAGD